MMTYSEIVKQLKSLRNPKNVAGMARFGINTENTLGISVPTLRKLARDIGKDHEVALRLWSTGIHEARILAPLIDRAELVTARQMDAWVRDFDSWDVCDQCCMNLFDKTELAHQKAREWSRERKEFVKRAGFALMATLAVHDKAADDVKFERFLTAVKRESTDNRNYVRKAVNWALRQIGKRNSVLHGKALKIAREIQRLDSVSARWIASDALRELASKAVRLRVRKAKRSRKEGSGLA